MSYLFLLCFNYQNWLDMSFLKKHARTCTCRYYIIIQNYIRLQLQTLKRTTAQVCTLWFRTLFYGTFRCFHGTFDLWTVLFVSWTVRVVYCTVRFASCTVRFAKYTYTLCERFVRFNNEVRLIWTLWFRFIFF